LEPSPTHQEVRDFYLKLDTAVEKYPSLLFESPHIHEYQAESIQNAIGHALDYRGEVILPPDMEVIDCSREYSAVFGNWNQVTTRPREYVLIENKQGDQWHVAHISGPASDIAQCPVTDHIPATIRRKLGRLTENDIQFQTNPPSRLSMDQLQALTTIKGYIERLMGEPQLSMGVQEYETALRNTLVAPYNTNHPYDIIKSSHHDDVSEAYYLQNSYRVIAIAEMIDELGPTDYVVTDHENTDAFTKRVDDIQELYRAHAQHEMKRINAVINPDASSHRAEIKELAAKQSQQTR